MAMTRGELFEALTALAVKHKDRAWRLEINNHAGGVLRIPPTAVTCHEAGLSLSHMFHGIYPGKHIESLSACLA